MTIDYMEAMDDAELGRQVKDAARQSAAEEVGTFAIRRMAALQLVCECFPANATESVVRLENVTYKGEEKGNWTVTARMRKPQPMRDCPTCGKEFRKSRKDQVSCSAQCRKRFSYLNRGKAGE